MSKVAIRPYVRKDIANHGLEKHGMVIADNCEHGQWLRCLDNGNGVKTYITGLNEGIAAVQELPEEQRDARILDIRKTVVMLENQIAGNYSITEADIYLTEKKMVTKKGPGGREFEEEVVIEKFNPMFWSKVTKFRSVIPDTFENGIRVPTYWDTVQLVCTNTPKELDTKNPYNVMLIKAIEAGGFGDLLATSLEDAQNAVKAPKFYLDRIEQTAELEVQDKRLRNKAGAKLEEIMNKDQDKLFYLVKNLAQYSLGYRRITPHTVIYGDIERYLDGLGGETNKKIAIEQFLDLCDTKKYPPADLRIRAIAKDAIAMNAIAPKGDNILYYIRKGSPMGKNFEDVVMYLTNPANSNELLDVTSEVEKLWNGKL